MVAPARWASTVAGMTNQRMRSQSPARSSKSCHVCGHPLDPHVMVLVREAPVPMGLGCCPHPQCDCGWTWRANAGPSTQVEIAETRRLVCEALIQDGYPVPIWLST